MTKDLRTIALALLLLTSLAVGSAAATPEPAATDDATENASLGSSSIRVAAEPGQVIDGTADLPEGTALELHVRTTNASIQFLTRTTVTVTPEATFAAEFDFSEQSPGDEFVVRVVHDGEELDAAEGRIVDDLTATPTASSTATATASSTPTPDPTETSIPGFGTATALLALLAVLVAIGAGRRQ